jgi:hypothetical protein
MDTSSAYASLESRVVMSVKRASTFDIRIRGRIFLLAEKRRQNTVIMQIQLAKQHDKNFESLCKKNDIFQ